MSSAERSEAPKRQRSPQHADPSAAKGHAQNIKLYLLALNYKDIFKSGESFTSLLSIR
ncbi:MAG: hypothetical protein NZ455_00585 [Bacteroidia bacterium]|nr:hypothetical protein [Bacteroidia bacterium]MDW8347033.1 hypothetical protein [Bacteroidia bacterium]